MEHRVWALICSFIFGLIIRQTTGQDNSTQTIYAKLMIDDNALGNITQELLDELSVDHPNLTLSGLQKTTICGDSTHTTSCSCSCQPGYMWSEAVLQKSKCTDKITCIFRNGSSFQCISNHSVTLTGSVTINGKTYINCTKARHNEYFKKCNEEVLEKLKRVFSTLEGFDTAKIIKYRLGSIIADFEVTIAHTVAPLILTKKSEELVKILSAKLDIRTKGVVTITVPTGPVLYDDKSKVECNLEDGQTIETVPVWTLTSPDEEVFDVTNGTESTVSTVPSGTKVKLWKITELWAGTYTCIYNQKMTNYSITHTASGVLDVCLLPNIYIRTAPGFPNCKGGKDIVVVKAICEIPDSSEIYTVTWTENGEGLDGDQIKSSEGKQIYEATTVVDCEEEPPNMTCTFHNRCNQIKKASIHVNIIKEGDPHCPAEEEWEDTKAGFTAVLPCKKEAGQKTRKCKNGSTAQWGLVQSSCVNNEVNSVLQRSSIVDIGRGTLSENTAHVFSRLKIVTNKSVIDSSANLNASVFVLVNLSNNRKLRPNNSATDDFLDSSSNMLKESLNNSWVPNDDQGNKSLAERYLSSVEELIQVANLTHIDKKENIEATARDCSRGSKCENTVFNVTIELESPNPGSVKSAGFKRLQQYLPNNDSDFKPNTIVVSTTAERKESVTVRIKFPLTEPRRRNVRMKCVSWNNYSRKWSQYGCDLEKGDSQEAHCTCTHLSSFAILMSREPLRVTGLNELTYVGLSVSIVSLALCLVIEVIVWTAVVKTHTLYLRHSALVNICLCLLVADCFFLASSNPQDLDPIWCMASVLLKHFCYLSMFFWMLCLSVTLLHQTVFLFHTLSKKTYLRFSIVVGYLCPLLLVTITVLAYQGGAEGSYYSKETCWLVYNAPLDGSIHTFVMPVGIIVIVNIFSMVVVIIKLLDHSKTVDKSNENEKKAAKTVMRSVILLTPIFGVTWIFGFCMMLVDLTTGVEAYLVHYAFTLLNAFQGFFILLTVCPGDKLTREALRNRFTKTAPSSNDSFSKTDSSWKK